MDARLEFLREQVEKNNQRLKEMEESGERLGKLAVEMTRRLNKMTQIKNRKVRSAL